MKIIRAAMIWLALAPAAFSQVASGIYIVVLAGPPAADFAHILPHAKEFLMESRRVQLRALSAGTEEVLRGSGVEILHRMDTLLNALILRSELTEAELAALPGVVRVIPATYTSLMMERSAERQNLHLAWAWTGVERAGAGVKIAIIDSGVDISQPSFQASSLPFPDGFPIVVHPDDRAHTNNKVIVARNYTGVAPGGVSTPTLRDLEGHGTAVAMAAAGVPVSSQVGMVSGVAPGAWIGSYKVGDERVRSDMLLTAMEHAFLDGMDVLNLSFGSDLLMVAEDDLYQQVADRLSSLGIIVVSGAGNSGPNPSTITRPGKQGETTLTVGGMANDRVITGRASVAGRMFTGAIVWPPPAAQQIAGSVVDVGSISPDSLACQPLRQGSLVGAIALLNVGECTVRTKMNNVTAAGAAGAILVNIEPGILNFSSAATAPAQLISTEDGQEIRRMFSSGQSVEGTLDFSAVRMLIPGDNIAAFSSRGPSAGYTIKPDVVAVASGLIVAGSKDSTRWPAPFLFAAGTSLAGPQVAGGAAVLMSSRKGLAPSVYRSLLVNTATLLRDEQSRPIPVMHQGAGLLNMDAALRANTALSPVSISFGHGPAQLDQSRSFILTNIGLLPDTYSLQVEPFLPGPVPMLDPANLTLAAGESARIAARFSASGLEPRAHEGVIRIRGQQPDSSIHMAYWYGVDTPAPRFIYLGFSVPSRSAGSEILDAIILRVNNAIGTALTDPQPSVEVVSGGGQVVNTRSLDTFYPGHFGVTVRLGPSPGNNVFRIRAGDLTREVTIVGN
ncbi:MAG: hypothetical protein FJW20_26800 [Acidimicrobiia bacterium]|nr:hypothetical protein [Acidimicrobiia bacterium]